MEVLGGKTQDRSFEMAIESFDKGGNLSKGLGNEEWTFKGQFQAQTTNGSFKDGNEGEDKELNSRITTCMESSFSVGWGKYNLGTNQP